MVRSYSLFFPNFQILRHSLADVQVCQCILAAPRCQLRAVLLHLGDERWLVVLQAAGPARTIMRHSLPKVLRCQHSIAKELIHVLAEVIDQGTTSASHRVVGRAAQADHEISLTDDILDGPHVVGVLVARNFTPYLLTAAAYEVVRPSPDWQSDSTVESVATRAASDRSVRSRCRWGMTVDS